MFSEEDLHMPTVWRNQRLRPTAVVNFYERFQKKIDQKGIRWVRNIRLTGSVEGVIYKRRSSRSAGNMIKHRPFRRSHCLSVKRIKRNRVILDHVTELSSLDPFWSRDWVLITWPSVDHVTGFWSRDWFMGTWQIIDHVIHLITWQSSIHVTVYWSRGRFW